VVVNFARVTVQLVGVDQLPSVLPSFSTVFNVTNGTEDDVVDIVVDIDNDSSAVRTTTSTTTESDAWLCKVVQPQPVNETDVGEDSDVLAACGIRGSSILACTCAVSDSPELIALLNFTRTRLIFCAQRQLLGSLPVQATSFDVPDLGQQSHILQGLRDAGKTLAESAYAESSIASGGTRVEDAEASVVNVTFADEDASWKTASELPEQLGWSLGFWPSEQIFDSRRYPETTDLETAREPAQVESFVFYLSELPPSVGRRPSIFGHVEHVPLQMDDPDVAEDVTVVADDVSARPLRNKDYAPETALQTFSALSVVGPESASNGVVYTKSELVEQTTPVSIALSDADASVSEEEWEGKPARGKIQSRSAVDLQDLDLDFFQIGGVLSWAEPADTAQVIRYVAGMQRVVWNYELFSSKALKKPQIRALLSVLFSSGLESTTNPHAVNEDIYWASDLLNSSSGFVCSYESDGLAARQHTVI
ncbi:unnamed protein product, partial [Symbiodinium microadriaticum]